MLDKTSGLQDLKDLILLLNMLKGVLDDINPLLKNHVSYLDNTSCL